MNLRSLALFCLVANGVAAAQPRLQHELNCFIGAVPESYRRAASAGPAEYPTPTCRTHDALSPEDAKNVCDPRRFLKMLLDVQYTGSVSARDRDLALYLAEEVWAWDDTLGTDLPWEELRLANYLAMVARFLGPHARRGRTRTPLAELQQFSMHYLEFVRTEACGASNVPLAIELLGILDTPGQTATLERFIREGPEDHSLWAIMALGERCDTASAALLQDLPGELKFSPRQSAALKVARKIRESPDRQSRCEASRSSQTPSARRERINSVAVERSP